jgi:GMP synthase (glutamine-hydrolysing)
VKPLLCLRHEAPDHLGTAAEIFDERGIPIRYFDLWKDPTLPEPSEGSGVVVLGGVMNVHQTDEHTFLSAEPSFIAEAVDAAVPLLGICLGAQLLALARGASVRRAPRREFGFVPLRPTEAAADDPVLGCLREDDRMFQWHQDTFVIPSGAALMVTGEHVRNQAFAAPPNAWGIQFHAEVTPDLLEDWLSGEEDDLLRRRWGRSAAEVRQEADRYLGPQVERAREIFGRFAAIVLEPA